MITFFIQAFEFLFRSLFDIVIFSFIFQFVLQLVKGHFFNPFSQTLLKITHPILSPLRAYLPSTRRIDIPCLSLLLLLTFIKLTCLFWIQFQQNPKFAGLAIWTLGDLSSAILNFFFFAVLGGALMSWVNPTHPLGGLLAQITEPLMRSVRRYLRPINGFDLAPLPVLIGLQFFIMLLAVPLTRIGLSLALHG